jgi:hypothetical protein
MTACIFTGPPPSFEKRVGESGGTRNLKLLVFGTSDDIAVPTASPEASLYLRPRFKVP